LSLEDRIYLEKPAGYILQKSHWYLTDSTFIGI